ncbi:MAG TPA: hypothetical protein VGQ83_32785 [Polyangia bacterium]
MGLFDATLKLLLRARAHDLLGLLPGVNPTRPLRLLDKEFAPPPPLPRALDGCLELADDEEDGTVFHVEFEAEPRSDTGLRMFRHCALAHLGLNGRPIRPVVFYLTPGTEARPPQETYGWQAHGRPVLEFRFETVCWWRLVAGEVLARPAPALWATVALCGGATLGDVGRAWAQIEQQVPELELRRDLAAVMCVLAEKRFDVHDLLRLVPREMLMESTLYQELFPEAFEKARREGQLEGRLEGEQKGRLEGLRVACLALVRAKAGSAAAREATSQLAVTEDAARLEALLIELGAAQDAEAVRAAVARLA